MCGIVGYTGYRRATKILLSGLKRLEYRGYDSAGISVINKNEFESYASVGKIKDLINKIGDKKILGNIGISHTRWATHGKPTENNCHPHYDCSKKIAVVHNGIIENYTELKTQLIKENHKFTSETDTEVIGHLIEKFYKDNLLDAVIQTVKMLEGSYAIAVVSLSEPDKIICARLGSPLVIGKGINESFVASDILAVLPYTKDFIFLDDSEIAEITETEIKVYDYEKNEQKKAETKIEWDALNANKQQFKHYMLKEIFEQPDVINDTLDDKIIYEKNEIEFTDFKISDDTLKNINKIYIIACGTAWHAGVVGKYYLEEFAELDVEAAVASEFRYRNVPVKKNDLIIVVSQSGETADSLAALKKTKQIGAVSLGICNVRGSTLSRECDSVIYTNAGPEIGVASTKAFTTQITVLYLFAVYFAKLKNKINELEYKSYITEIINIPDKINLILDNFEFYKKLSQEFYNYHHFLYLGRHYNYPIALEGALKLKEISYIHAEGYASGEMKHGPIALITDEMPVVIIATQSFITDKVISNLQEVKARDGISIVFTNKGIEIPEELTDFRIDLPETIEALSPIINVIPLQILAYLIADFLGCDVDQPRNLAKSVTVE